MLNNVQIRNLALIREAEIDFKKGLNVLTGETGAGKSIIIGAVNIGLGDKANKSILRSDSESGGVELLFTNVGDEVINCLRSNDIQCDDGNVLITRKITLESSISKVNGQNVTLNILRKITSLLADISGQHDDHVLLDDSRHIDLLDFYGGDAIENIKHELKSEHAYYRNLRTDYKKYSKTEEDLKDETELIKHEMEEIDSAGLYEGEDEVIQADYKRLSNAENVINLLNRAAMCFSDDKDSIDEQIAEAQKNINEAYKLDEGLKDILDSVIELDSMASDIKHEIKNYIDTNEFKPEQYVACRERLDEVNHLKTKYGNSIEEILKYRENLEVKLNSFTDYFKVKHELEAKIHDSGIKLNEISKKLSDTRKRTAGELEATIINNLKDLNFADSRFEISLGKLERITENGFDRVEFMFSSNPGEPLLPLAKIASGGEISRILLAVKCSFADRDKIETLIFDEIDTGVSGRTAQMVAKKLYDLSRTHQIISISHLPQIAAMADSHFHIHKEVEDGNTISGITELNDDQMIKEIASLLGGEQISYAALENARDLKGNANFYKRKLK